jgi:hypothetical protein
MRAEKIRHFATVSILGPFLAAVVALFVFSPHIAPVEAQSGTVSFSLTFQVPVSSFTTYIPIPNRNQIGHTVNYSFATNPGNQLLANCGIFFDMANNGDGTTSGSKWATLAGSGNPFGQQNGSFSGNGYSTFYRLKIPECTPSAITITYVGYFSEIPILTLPFNGDNRYGSSPISIALPVRADPIYATPGVMNGFQCSNPDSSNGAWLQLYVASSAPTIGSGVVYETLIPAGQTIDYAGNPLSYYALAVGSTANLLFASAATGPGVGQAVTFNATPTAAGASYVQGDVGSNLTVTSCGATVEILQVNGGAGTGGVTQIGTSPVSGGSGCHTGAGQGTTGGTGSGATVNITAAAGTTAVTTPVICNFQTNGNGPYYPFNPPSL